MIVAGRWRSRVVPPPTIGSRAVAHRCGLHTPRLCKASGHLLASLRHCGSVSCCVAPSTPSVRRSPSNEPQIPGVPMPHTTTQNTPIESVLNYPYSVIDSKEALVACARSLSTATAIAVDLEALVTSAAANTRSKQLGQLSLVQLCSDAAPQIFLVDVLTVGLGPFTKALGPLFSSEAVRKFFFDCRRDVEALSCQAQIRTRGVIDLQLYYTALQWRLRSVNRRSSMPYVLKALTGIERKETDYAVHLAMTCGERSVWDIRPLPKHFLDYAADDVRHTFLLHGALTTPRSNTTRPSLLSAATSSEPQVSLDAVARLTEHYVANYATGLPVNDETDTRPAEVNAALLERFIGPGGCCAFCGARGHVASECYQKQHAKAGVSSNKSTNHSRGSSGTTRFLPPRDSHNRYPQLLKCDFCGRLGHNTDNCFKKHPCTHCGGEHHSDFCRHRLRTVPFFDFQSKTV